MHGCKRFDDVVSCHVEDSVVCDQVGDWPEQALYCTMATQGPTHSKENGDRSDVDKLAESFNQ